jgi:hypothetical protein
MQEKITSVLETINVNDYQVVDKVIARSVKGDPRLDTAVWPGYNVIITMQITDPMKARMIVNILRKMNTDNYSNPDEMITVCSWEMEEYFFD